METGRKGIEEALEEANRLNERLSRKVERFEAVQETGKAILTILDPGELMDVILGKLSEVCRIHRGVFLLVNESGKRLEFAHGIGFRGDVPEGVRTYSVSMTAKEDFLTRVARTGRPEYVEDLRDSSLVRENVLTRCEKAVSVYAVPLVNHARVIGVVAAAGEPGSGIPPESRESLDLFSSQIAIALENARLYSLLERRMEDLHRSRALLSRADKLSFLGDMAARLAHEIKNPLTAIGTFIQMLPRKYDDEAYRTEFHQIALEETARINNILGELMELAKPREACFERVDLRVLIEKMVLLLSPRARKKGVKVTIRHAPDPDEMVLDAEKTKQVLLNVLSNALDAVPSGGRIRVSTGVVRDSKGAEWVRIEVSDNGCGISEEALERVFEPYYSTKARGKTRDGAGLGLFIAQQNMEEQGGEIEVKSRPGQGATFVLRLPRIREVKEPAPPKGSRGVAG